MHASPFLCLSHLRRNCIFVLPQSSRRRFKAVILASSVKSPASSPSSVKKTTCPRVVLKGGKSKLFTELQSPTVYGGAVDRVVGRPQPGAGDVVLVCDGAEQLIGWGVFNPNSMFRVRMMQLASEVPQDQLQSPSLERLLQDRLRCAVDLRMSLGLPSESTTVFRLCNSEGDRLSGLIVDVLGEHLVVSSSAAWVERQRGLITSTLKRLTGRDNVVWRPSQDMLREEGWAVQEPTSAASSEQQVGRAAEVRQGAGGTGMVDSGGSIGSDGRSSSHQLDLVGLSAAGDQRQGRGASDVPAAATTAAEALVEEGQARSLDNDPLDTDGVGAAGKTSHLSPPQEVVVLEAGVKYAAAPLGQKTGFYADQRDSRVALRQLARGKRVLDLCCYSGGFAINAAVGGAVQVLGVDSSAAALRLAQHNAALNGVEGCCSFEKADVADYLKQAVEREEQWDVVVLDPPKLAPNKKSLARATHRYRRLNTQAMRLVAPGGLLMSCSCSGAMSQSGDFLPMMQAAARGAGRRIAVLREAGAALDHTLDPAYPEGRYLTNILVRVL